MDAIPPHLLDLVRRIRELRERLRKLQPGVSLNEPHVLALSQEIDALIVQFMRETENAPVLRRRLERV